MRERLRRPWRPFCSKACSSRFHGRGIRAWLPHWWGGRGDAALPPNAITNTGETPGMSLNALYGIDAASRKRDEAPRVQERLRSQQGPADQMDLQHYVQKCRRAGARRKTPCSPGHVPPVPVHGPPAARHRPADAGAGRPGDPRRPRKKALMAAAAGRSLGKVSRCAAAIWLSRCAAQKGDR
ncbi:hypothetical protein TNIN_464591 [Trichonephila inaurata madagascariensis]|uniref:Uncharacterized protein n=1 Tax=Trichonephila inaurata madagascariensis TaxID=2747483 RepID=A0A8X6YSE6_9ARAC|nr:hypothetical protein TNIN_464591 [Trichonephila inaurata madagascariensis]